MEESKGKFKIVKQEDAGSESDEEECVHGHFIQAEENDNSFSNKKKKIVLKKGSAAAAGGGGVLRNCQVDKCTADLSSAKQYHKRHRVCEVHAKAQVVVVAGIRQRFCQQCSRFHELSEFDETKRSCRRRLAGHNERRRKSTAEHHAEGSNRKVMDAQLKEMVCGQVNDSSRIKIAVQENSTNYKHFQIS